MNEIIKVTIFETCWLIPENDGGLILSLLPSSLTAHFSSLQAVYHCGSEECLVGIHVEVFVSRSGGRVMVEAGWVAP